MPDPFKTALETLRRCQAGLVASTDLEERDLLSQLHADALALLEEGSKRRRLSSQSLIARFRALDRELADRTPGERATIIRARLGLCRSRYYEIKKSA